MAIGLGLCDCAHADGVSGAGAVFHDNRLTEPRRDLIHDEARHDIGGAAGGQRHDHAIGFAGQACARPSVPEAVNAVSAIAAASNRQRDVTLDTCAP